MTFEERVAVVSAFEGVHQVIHGAPMIVDREFLSKWSIDVVCISPEYSADDDPYYALPREMGIVRVMTRTPGISTSELIKRIRQVSLECQSNQTTAGEPKFRVGISVD